MTPNAVPPAIIWPAPKEEIPSPDFTLEVQGTPVFVYQARVRTEILQKPGLWSHQPDAPAERASFAIFDLAAPATLSIKPARPFRTAAIWPANAGITPDIHDGVISFPLSAPRHLTLMLDGSDREPLHLFVGKPETDVPRPDDPNVVYFGPGTHRIEQLSLKKGQTLYLAGGAVVKAALAPEDKGTYNEKWQVTFHSGYAVGVTKATGVRICGRGILDGSLMPHPARGLIGIYNSSGIRLEGITLRDSANWNVTIADSDKVEVEDLRLISGRLNSDGINSVNSRHVSVRRCFVRNFDDSIVVKTLQPGRPAEDITVEDCTIWSDWGFALGVTYETRSPIQRVRFSRCAIVYARHWCLGLRVCDSALIRDIVFENIEIADLRHTPQLGGAHDALTREPRLAWFGIVKDVWGKDAEAGLIRGVRVENVTVYGNRLPPSDIIGFDAAHPVEDITFRGVHLAGQAAVTNAAALGIRTNAFVKGLTIEP
jgi:hypothetical protein